MGKLRAAFRVLVDAFDRLLADPAPSAGVTRKAAVLLAFAGALAAFWGMVP